MPPRFSALALVVCAALLFTPAYAVIFKFDVSLPQGHRPEVDHTTMFSPEDSPASGYPGNGDTWISYNLNFTWRGSGMPNGVVHSVIVPWDYLKGEMPKCCMAKDCQEGELDLALPRDADFKGVFHERILFNGSKNGLVLMRTEHKLHQSGWYYHYIINCPSSHVPAVEVVGEMVWLNPYGYLPADEFPFLWFYMVMLLVYIVLAVGWGALLYINRQDIISLQVAITIALSISLIEGSVFYLYYFLYNNTGDFIIAIFLVGILMDCTRITFSALLLLAVARGYLVVNESLGSPKLIAGVLAAATGYWITILSTSMVHALIENTTYQIADNTMPALDLLIILFAFSYYCFLFYSLITTIAKLKAAQEWVKLKLYINLMLILILACILAFLCQLVELVVVWDTPLEAGLYQYGWVWEAYWQLLYLLIICALAVLLRPSPFNRRYAYAQVSMQERPLDQIQKQFTIDSEGEVVPNDDNSVGATVARPDAPPASPAPAPADAPAPAAPIESKNTTNEASGPVTDSDTQPLTQKSGDS